MMITVRLSIGLAPFLFLSLSLSPLKEEVEEVGPCKGPWAPPCYGLATPLLSLQEFSTRTAQIHLTASHNAKSQTQRNGSEGSPKTLIVQVALEESGEKSALMIISPPANQPGEW